MKPIADRFWSKVEKTPDCWLWVGGLNGNKYGSFYWDRILGAISAHRAAYLLEHGEIPRTLGVLHTCDVRNCVNPQHLYLGTAKDNAADREARGRQIHPFTTHCKFGHLRTKANTRINTKPSRDGAIARTCRDCDRRRAAEYRARRRTTIAK